MHSLKNTIVAVGLLGLSFVFYQFSSKTPPEEQLMNPLEPVNAMVAAIDSPATGETDPPANRSAEPTPKPQPPADPWSSESKSVATAPELPEFTVPDFGSTKPAAKSPQQPSPAANEFDAPPIADLKPQPQPQPRQPSPLELDPPPATSPNPTSPSGNDFAAADPVSRDQGLIQALETQRQSEPSNRFETNPHTAPKPQNDNSMGLVPATPDDSSEFTAEANIDPNNTQPQVTVAGNSEAATVTIPAPAEYASITFRDAWPIVDEMVAQDRLQEALALLSQYYDDEELSGPQRQALTAWLDALAGKVIFSTENHLDQPYRTNGGETFAELGQRWNVPGQLVFNVNRERVTGTQAIPAGTELKVIRGPFDARINRETETMTLFLGDMYAGRFSVRIGISGDPKPGQFKVMMKSRKGFDWKDANGTTYAPGDPNNHYGEFFMGLEGFLSIHAIDESKQSGHWGCLGLLEEDARNVFAILGPGSTVTIE